MLGDRAAAKSSLYMHITTRSTLQDPRLPGAPPRRPAPIPVRASRRPKPQTRLTTAASSPQIRPADPRAPRATPPPAPPLPRAPPEAPRPRALAPLAPLPAQCPVRAAAPRPLPAQPQLQLHPPRSRFCVVSDRTNPTQLQCPHPTPAVQVPFLPCRALQAPPRQQQLSPLQLPETLRSSARGHWQRRAHFCMFEAHVGAARTSSKPSIAASSPRSI